MARRSVGDRQIVLALHERGETRDLFVASDEPAGIVAGVAAEVILGRFDPAVADRRRAHEVHREPPKMRQAFGGGAFDRP